MNRERTRVSSTRGLVAQVVERAGLEDRVVVREAARADWRDALQREEAALVQDVHARRRTAFAAGRACAHDALDALGVPRAPLLRVGGGGEAAEAPAWPGGCVGSIAHADAHCAAIVARDDELIALGLDVESTHRVSTALFARVTTSVERAHFASARTPVPPALAFVAKEAAYKAWSPITGRRLGFRDVEIRPGGAGRFEALFVGGAHAGPLGGGPHAGAFARIGDLIAALVFAPAA